MRDVVKTEFEDFGRRELKKAVKLLEAYIEQGTPDYFEDRGVHIAFNTTSSYVFLTNEEYEVAMLDGDELKKWFMCPECGFEGFKEQLKQQGDECCQDYIMDFE